MEGTGFETRQGWIALSRDIDRAHAKRSFSNNMADADDLFFFGDDFDLILGILEEEEEELDEQFRELLSG